MTIITVRMILHHGDAGDRSSALRVSLDTPPGMVTAELWDELRPPELAEHFAPVRVHVDVVLDAGPDERIIARHIEPARTSRGVVDAEIAVGEAMDAAARYLDALPRIA